MTLKERLGLSDRDILAKTIQAEAGNQGAQGMLAVGSVIMNRAKASGYGGGIQDVILKPGQFSPWNSETNYAGGAQGQDMMNLVASPQAYAVTDAVLSGKAPDPTSGATHFYNPDISNPSWGAEKQGGDWTRINSHLFGKADAGRSSNQRLADDAMRAIGKQPIGLADANIIGLADANITGLADANIKENSQMMQQRRPRGLLENFGIQKMQEGAEGETGQRFYNRDTFKDKLADLAVGFGKMGIMGLDEPAAAVANRRAEKRKLNKTAEYLDKYMPGAGDLIRDGFISAKDAIAFTTDKNTQDLAARAAEAYRSGNTKEAMALLTQISPTSMGQQLAAQVAPRKPTVAGDGKYTVNYDPETGSPIISVNQSVIDAEARIAAAKREAEVEEERNKPMPTDARKAEEEDLDSIDSLGGLIEDTASIIKDFGYNSETGNFEGPLDIGLDGMFVGTLGKFGLGKENVETAKARQKFDRFKTRLINESLRLNKGVQTEGDAQRAANELGSAKTDATAYAAVQELMRINTRAREISLRSIGRRRETFNKKPLNMSESPTWRIKK